jgi:urease accessory protein
LLIQRAFYPEPSGVCHLYLVHPPGGIVGGDRLRFDALVETGAHALVTTPAATKLYRSAGLTAGQHTLLRVAADARMEWLPQETLVFNGAQAELSTRVELERGARFLGWELMCLGRPANGERFLVGGLRQRFELWREGRPLWIERSHYAGGDHALESHWGLGGKPVFATLVATLANGTSILEDLRSVLAACEAPGRCVATVLDEVIVCRYVGPWAEAAREHLVAAWRVLRPHVMGTDAQVPRIWNT